MQINNNKQINTQKIKELPTDIRHHIVQFLDTPSRAATRFTDKQERFPLERHYELALSQEVKQGTSHDIRQNLALYPDLYRMPQEVISTLLNDNETVRRNLAENPNLYKIPQEIFISDYDIGKLHIVRDVQKVENMLDTGHVDDATTLLNSLMKKVNQNDLHGIGEVGHEFRKILSNIVKKSTALYAHNEDTKPLHLMFNLLKAGKLPEFEADDPEEEPDAPFSKHLKEVVDCAVQNTMNGNGELGNKLLSLAHTSKTDTQLPYLLKGHEVFRGKDKAMLYRLLSSPMTAENKENVNKMLKQMLPLYDAGHFAEGGTFGVLLPKIVDFIKKNPLKEGFWNVNDLPECDFKTIYKKSWGKLAEMKKNFNLSEPKQSVDKLYNS